MLWLRGLRGSPCFFTVVIRNSNCRVVEMLLSRNVEGSFRSVRVGERVSSHLIQLSKPLASLENRPPDVTIYRMGRNFLWVDSPSCKSCEVIATNPAIPTNITLVRDTGVVVSFISPGPLVCKKIMDEMKARGLEVERLSSRSLDLKQFLTRRQREVLYTAFSMGYFSYSRETTLGELAKTLGLSKSTVSRHLRAAVRKLAITSSRDQL